MEPKPTALKILDIAAILLLLAALYMVFIYAPMEATMGNVQRVFYFHIATAWVGMMSFIVALVAGVAYLSTSDRKWDIIGVAGIEVGLVFLFITIVSGSIWARPAWNTWWTWDPRLVTTTVMELVYIAYFMLRQGIEDPDRRARFGAIYAILGASSVPLTFFSIRIWRTIHPVVVGSGNPDSQGTFDMSDPMRAAFFFSIFTFTVIGIDLIWHRIRLGRFADKVERLKMKVMI
ncbi:MAG: cytochrome c biogenesis protein CcsA [Anaerolineae bacterium]|nr:cytochrome c biogenesis protein CcsA [Anaerolineae bacterium]